MIKRSVSVLLIMIMCFSMSVSCSFTEDKDCLSVVTTIFPLYDWTRQITGEMSDGVEITLLNSNGTDMHSYQPTADDIIKLSTCDLFIYIGGESDDWIDDALKNAVNKDMTVINILELLGEGKVKQEETVEGMETEGESDEADEHIWLSLRYASEVCEIVCEKISQLDPDNAEIYSLNKESYLSELSELDNKFESAVNSSKIKTLLFADRFPFRYLTDDYGLKYYAAFPGCSSESEASFETVVFLAGKVDELALSSVLTIDGSTSELANTVVSAAKSDGIKILTLNSMQTVTSESIDDGVTYISVMQSNLDVIKEALK